MPTEEKVFGRYHDLILLLLGFALTTFLGNFVAQRYQERASRQQREADDRRREIEAASAVFNEVSRMMDRRHYRMLRVLWDLQGDTQHSDLDSRWREYREVLTEWNESLNRNLALVERYYGRDLREVFEGRVHWGFRELGKKLESSRAKAAPATLEDAARAADQVNNDIYGFNLAMLERIQRGAVGAFMPETPRGGPPNNEYLDSSGQGESDVTS